MRGGSGSQVGYLMSQILDIGASKHIIQSECRSDVKVKFTENNPDPDKRPTAQLLTHETAKSTPIFGYGTKHTYSDIWIDLLNYTKEGYVNGSGETIKIKDLEKMTPEAVDSFLNHKIDIGVAHKTFRNYAGALTKLNGALNKFADIKETGRSYDFQLKPKCDVRVRASEELTDKAQSRRYEDPKSMASTCNTLNERSGIASSVQYEGGARVSEFFTLRSENFIGNNKIHLTNTKGGLERTITVSHDTYTRALNYVENNNGRMLHPGENPKQAADAYRSDLRRAAEDTGQKYQASHGLRWNFAAEKYNQYIKDSCTPHQAMAYVSRDLGHHRADITAHYLT